MPIYKPVPIDEVNRLDQQYQKSVSEKKPDQKALDQLKVQLDQDMDKIFQNFELHKANIDQLLKGAQSDLKWAKEAAEKYRKKADPQWPPQVKNFVAKISKAREQATEDVRVFGQTWFNHREYNGVKIPATALAAFKARRMTLQNNGKDIPLKTLQISALATEASGLADLVEKASRKRLTGFTRDITVAQRAARELADQMERLRDEARTPPGRTAQPGAIKTGSEALVRDAADKKFTAIPANLGTSEGRFAQVEQSYKGLNTRVNAMVALLPTKQRAFHTAELKDPVVKVEMARAAKAVADAKADVKLYAPMYAKAQTAIKKIQAAFKARKK